MTDDCHVSLTGGLRKNAGKLRLDLVPASLVRAVARVLGKGTEKYAPRNWEKGIEFASVGASLERHLLAWKDGEDYDAESGELHMAHVVTNAAFLIEYGRRIADGTLPGALDDRPRHAPLGGTPPVTWTQPKVGEWNPIRTVGSVLTGVEIVLRSAHGGTAAWRVTIDKRVPSWAAEWRYL